jgi:hypothetical protein
MQALQKPFTAQRAQLQKAASSRASVRAPVVVRAQKQEVGTAEKPSPAGAAPMWRSAIPCPAGLRIPWRGPAKKWRRDER